MEFTKAETVTLINAIRRDMDYWEKRLKGQKGSNIIAAITEKLARLDRILEQINNEQKKD